VTELIDNFTIAPFNTLIESEHCAPYNIVQGACQEHSEFMLVQASPKRPFVERIAEPAIGAPAAKVRKVR
jgi:hypothetical protein